MRTFKIIANVKKKVLNVKKFGKIFANQKSTEVNFND